MNWKIIFQLSVFGLIMAIGTISLIPETVEPVFWLAIFIFCAYIIARVVGTRHFLHGFCISLVNSIWITAAHIIFYSSYIANHPNAYKMYTELQFLPTHPRLAMLILGPLFGIVFGLILGLFCFIASFIVKKKAAAF